jgi:hypothetical protein
MLLEAVLDSIGWVWCRRTSLLLDELVIRQEQRGERAEVSTG